eukprot:2854490-Rhodomonas_salina.2
MRCDKRTRDARVRTRDARVCARRAEHVLSASVNQCPRGLTQGNFKPASADAARACARDLERRWQLAWS